MLLLHTQAREDYLLSLLPTLPGYLTFTDTNVVVGFSTHALFHIKVGMRLDMFFYGHTINTLLQHLRRHLEWYFTQDDTLAETMALGIHFPLGLDEVEVEKNLIACLGELNRNPEPQVWLLENCMAQ